MALNIQVVRDFFILSKEDKDIYAQVIVETNTKRAFALALLSIPLVLFNIISFANNIELESGGRLLWRQNVILVHLCIFTFAFISALTMAIQWKRNGNKIKPNNTLVNLVIVVLLTSGILIAVIDQMLHIGIYAYLLVAIALGITFYIQPIRAIVLFTSAFLCFFFAIALETFDVDLLLNARVNAFSFTFVGLGLSMIFWRMNLKHIKLTQLVQKQNEELLIQHAEKDQLFSIIAHDLKGPIGSFLSLTEVMSDATEENSKEELVTMSQALHRSSKKLYALLENLLEYARVKLQMVKINPVKINVLKMGEECIFQYEELAKNKNISLKLNLPSNIEFTTDAFMMQTVFRNILTNAIKFSKVGGQIEIGYKGTSHDFICIYVKDNGIGMDDKILKSLFKMGAKVGRLGTKGEASSGLGLLLCKELMDKLNGKIEVQSEVNVGTTFCLTFPINLNA